MQEFFNAKVQAENARQTQAHKLGVDLNDSRHGDVQLGNITVKKEKNALEEIQEKENLAMARRIAELEEDLRLKNRLLNQVTMHAANYDYIRGEDPSGNPPGIPQQRFD